VPRMLDSVISLSCNTIPYLLTLLALSWRSVRSVESDAGSGKVARPAAERRPLPRHGLCFRSSR
jgi:hypothetical protein